MHLEFEKWHGCKNDFLVTWITRADKDLVVPSLRRQAARLCDRTGAGVAADGILVLVTTKARDTHPDELIIINSDGTLARNCGNGLRCAARSILRKIAAAGTAHADMPPAIELSVEGRKFHCKVFGPPSANGLIGVDMGEATVEEITPAHPHWKDIHEAMTRAGHTAASTIRAQGTMFTVDVGNPHLVVLASNLSEDDLSKGLSGFATSIQGVGGRDGINVHIARECNPVETGENPAIKSRNFQVDQTWQAVPWERGVGLTQACGSGAVAIAAAINARDAMGESAHWTAIRMPGGQLLVQISDGNHTLAGPAELVFTGSVEI